MSATSSAATYVGRIGGLAVALGVGAAIASGSGAAWADSSDSSSSSGTSSSSSGTSSSASDKPAPRSSKDRSADARPSKKTRDQSADPDRPSTGDSGTDAAPDAEKKDNKKKDDEPAAESGPAKQTEPSDESVVVKRQKNSSADRQDRATAAQATAAQATAPAKSDTAATPAPTVKELTDTSLAGPLTTPIKVGVKAPPPRLVTRVLSALGVTASAGNAPTAPTQSPALLALLGWVRREVERNVTPVSQTSASTAAATYAAAAVVDPLPGRLPSLPVGWVTGQNNAGWLGGHPVPQTQNTAGFNIYGTDLGIMWDGGTIDGQRFVHVAFGDTFSGPNMQGGWRNNALLISFDNRLDNGLYLAPTGPVVRQFIAKSNGQLGLLGSEVTVIPSSGIAINGRQYVNYMSVKSWDTPGSWTTNYSAVVRYNPATDNWDVMPSTIRSAGWLRSSTPYVAGSQNFQQMAYVLQPEDQVAEGEDRYLYAFGTPSGRQGSAYLSRVAEGDVSDLAKYEYWDGDKWVAGNAAVAAPIIGDSTNSAGLFGFVVDWANDPNVFGGYLGGLVGAKTGGNVSEMSVQYNEYLDKYVVLYGDGNNNIQMRVADTPEGEWSEPVTVATSIQYPGLYAPMIHPWSGTGELEDASGASDYNNLYWNMSIWGDYNVVMMQTDLSPLQTVQV